MSINPVENITYTCPLFVKTYNGEYINANNIVTLTPEKKSSFWCAKCNDDGPMYFTEYEIADEEAKKILNIQA